MSDMFMKMMRNQHKFENIVLVMMLILLGAATVTVVTLMGIMVYVFLMCLV